MKLILIVRNPVTRAISHFTHFLSSKRVNTSEIYPTPSNLLQNTLYDENWNFKINLSDTSIANYLANIVIDSMYVTHLKVWYNYFAREQIVIVNGEELIKNPLNELKKIENFLELKPYFNKDHFEFDVKKGFFCINGFYKGERGRKRCLNSEKGRLHPKIDKIILDKLFQFFEPLNIEFFKLINKKPFW